MSKKDDYCKDCDRSIYGSYPSCDINIENNGKFPMGENDVCYCKVKNGNMVEDYKHEA